MGSLLLLQGLCGATPLLGMEIQDVGHSLKDAQVQWIMDANNQIGYWYKGDPKIATKKFTAYNVYETLPKEYKKWYSQVDKTIFAFHNDYLPDKAPSMYENTYSMVARVKTPGGKTIVMEFLRIGEVIVSNLFLMHWRHIPSSYPSREKEIGYDHIHPMYHKKVYHSIFTLTMKSEDQLEQMHFAAEQYDILPQLVSKLSIMLETPAIWQLGVKKGVNPIITSGNKAPMKTYFIPVFIQNIHKRRPTVWYSDGYQIFSTDDIRERLAKENIDVDGYFQQWFYFRNADEVHLPFYDQQTDRPPIKEVLDQGEATHEKTPEPTMMDHVREGVKHALYDVIKEMYSFIMGSISNVISVMDYASPHNSLRLLLVFVLSARYGFTISSIIVALLSIALVAVEMTIADLTRT